MPSPDGISTEDWDAVHELSLEIVNAKAEAEAKIFTRHLLLLLDDLEEKYGALPSILATRADYTKDENERAAYLRQAYTLAEAIQDKFNMKEIAHSLAELYIEDLKDFIEGRVWLDRLSGHLESSCNEMLHEEMDRLRLLLDRQSP